MPDEAQAATPAANGVDNTSPPPDAQPDAPSSSADGDDKAGMLAAVIEAVPPSPDADKLDLPEGSPTSAEDAGDQPDAEASSQQDQKPEGEQQPPVQDQALPDAEAAKAEASVQKEGGETEKTVTEELDALSEDEIKTFHPSSQKRIRQFLEERAGTRERVQELEGQVETLSEAAQPLEALQGFLTEHRISQENFTQGMEVLAAFNGGNYQRFLEVVTPFYQAALEATGQALPQDLYDQVQAGNMTADAAAQASRERSAGLLAQQQAAHAQQDAQVVAHQSNAAELKHTMNAWEAKKQKDDPEYSAKRGLVQTHVRSLMQQVGVPQTVNQAVEIADAAYDLAVQEIKRLQPKPRPTPQTPDGSASGNNTPPAPPEPANMLDAALQGLDRYRQSVNAGG